ncbi:MAG: SLBB domain-containing protein [Blastocatellales bacterium]|nr:SLBB domain-containing protein [Blastocatellales bacterium]
MSNSSRYLRNRPRAVWAIACAVLFALAPVSPLFAQTSAIRTDRADQSPQPQPDRQTGPGGVFRLPDRANRFTPADALAQFETPVEASYRLDAGDEITLEIWGRAELSGKHTIGPDGRITLPLLGPVQITGLTREEAAQAVETAYITRELYRNLAVTVRVDRYVSNRIFVLGRVARPGVLEFDTPPTLLEAITRAGSLPVGGVGADKAALTKCAIFRGRDQVVWINLKQLLTEGDFALNIRMQRNDILYLPDSDDQLVYVLGEVTKPGAYRLTPNMTFMDALATAGGPTKDAADKLHLIRPNRDVNWEFRFKDALTPDSRLNASLEEGDVIFLERRGLAKFGYVTEKFAPLSGFLFIFTALRNNR